MLNMPGERLKFSKYHGTGNDFILVNAMHVSPPESTPEQIRRMCDRHLGIGGDGLIIIRPGKENNLAYEMEYYNADGMPGSFCGNGARCAVQFALDEGLITSGNLLFSAFDGVHAAIVENNQVKIQMHPPGEIKKLGDNSWFLDTGSPHHIIRVWQPELVDVEMAGKTVRNSERYAGKGTNVNFMTYMENQIEVRTFERGVEAETLSCGTGVVACTCVVSALSGYAGNFEVFTQGGRLDVFISPDTKEIWLSGSTVFVFKGEIVWDGNAMNYDTRK